MRNILQISGQTKSNHVLNFKDCCLNTSADKERKGALLSYQKQSRAKRKQIRVSQFSTPMGLQAWCGGFHATQRNLSRNSKTLL